MAIAKDIEDNNNNNNNKEKSSRNIPAIDQSQSKRLLTITPSLITPYSPEL